MIDLLPFIELSGRETETERQRERHRERDTEREQQTSCSGEIDQVGQEERRERWRKHRQEVNRNRYSGGSVELLNLIDHFPLV